MAGARGRVREGADTEDSSAKDPVQRLLWWIAGTAAAVAVLAIASLVTISVNDAEPDNAGKVVLGYVIPLALEVLLIAGALELLRGAQISRQAAHWRRSAAPLARRLGVMWAVSAVHSLRFVTLVEEERLYDQPEPRKFPGHRWGDTQSAADAWKPLARAGVTTAFVESFAVGAADWSEVAGKTTDDARPALADRLLPDAPRVVAEVRIGAGIASGMVDLVDSHPGPLVHTQTQQVALRAAIVEVIRACDRFELALRRANAHPPDREFVAIQSPTSPLFGDWLRPKVELVKETTVLLNAGTVLADRLRAAIALTGADTEGQHGLVEVVRKLCVAGAEQVDRCGLHQYIESLAMDTWHLE